MADIDDIFFLRKDEARLLDEIKDLRDQLAYASSVPQHKRRSAARCMLDCKRGCDGSKPCTAKQPEQLARKLGAAESQLFKVRVAIHEAYTAGF